MEFKMRDRTESDHLPVEIGIQSLITGEEKKKENKEIIESCDWSPERIKFYKEGTKS